MVVGGSWAGVTVIQELMELGQITYPRLQITLVEKRTHYFHKAGTVRGLSDQKFAESLFIPYDRVFNYGGMPNTYHRFICARLSSVHKHHIQLDDGAKIPYDYLVLATGTEYKSLPVMMSTNRMECQALFENMREAVSKAERILVVGGGAVGVVLSAELAEMHPGKHITFAHMRDKLFTEKVPDGFVDAVETHLKKVGVELCLGEIVLPPQPKASASIKTNSSGLGWQVRPQELITRSGRSIFCDLVIWTTGSEPDTRFMQSLPPSNPSKPLCDMLTGQIRVFPTLQLADVQYPHIFAVGDVNTQSIWEKYASNAVHQAKHAVINIKALMDECYDYRIKVSADSAADAASGAALVQYEPEPKKKRVLVLGRNKEITNSFMIKLNSWAKGPSKQGRRYVLDKAQRLLKY